MSSSTTESPQKAAAEKSSFFQTCSLLSRYLKDKGSFGDLSLEMFQFSASGTQQETKRTMNLFPGIEMPTESNPLRNTSSGKLLMPMDLFPQEQSSFIPPKEDSQQKKLLDTSVNKSASNGSTNTDPQAAQMTIFYAGQVIVFNDFPANKAREIMLLASQGSHPSPIVAMTSVDSCNASQVPLSSNAIPIQSTTSAIVGGDQPRIARRASLHRFLAKRKDRINTKAPYEINIPGPAPGGLHVETKSWLGLTAQFPQ